VASPVFAGGLIVQVSGGGGRGTVMLAVDPTGTGDVSSTHIVYKRDRELPYVPTPIAYGKHVYLWGDNGVVSCIESQTGQNIWTRRVPNGGNYSSSPICIDGKLYGLSESGDVAVLAASPEFKHLGTTSLGDPSNATPSVANGRLYLRTIHRLACVPAKP
jgi:outer membrane protein assembly factor BamB